VNVGASPILKTAVVWLVGPGVTPTVCVGVIQNWAFIALNKKSNGIIENLPMRDLIVKLVCFIFCFFICL
jgi:hypothetical protein